MNILIDIGHPAHIHLFKNFAHIIVDKGNKVLFTCRDKEFETNLLEANKFDYISFGKKYKSTLGKIWGLFKSDYLLWRVCRKFHPDFLLSHGSICASHIAWIMKKPHIAFEDTYNMEQIRLYRPFTDTILTSSSYFHPKISNKEIGYAGNHALAYLHPSYFQPNPSIFKKLGIKDGEKYVILRFVSWEASHDRGHKGISNENKIKAVSEFSKYAKIFISSEKKLPEALMKYKLPTPPEDVFDVMSFASLIYGESATMCEEAAALGVPSIYVDDDSRFYTKYLELQYGLIYNFSESSEDQLKSIVRGVELLTSCQSTEVWKQKKDNYLSDKIDINKFLVWFVENYPISKETMMENPEHQYRFGTPSTKAVPLTGGGILRQAA